MAATQDRLAKTRAKKGPAEQPAASRDREFRRLWALIGRRAKRAGITPEDVESEIESHRAGR